MVQNRSEEIKELATALAKAQSLFPEIPRDKTVKVKTKSGYEYEYKYAELSSIINATRKPLTENGLCFMQEIVETEKGMSCHTLLVHSSGQWKSSHTPMILKETDMQGMGAAMTFARRYGLQGIIGVASEEDTDGDAAKRGDQPKTQPKQQAKSYPKQLPPDPPPESIADYIDKPLTAVQKMELSKWVFPGGELQGKKLGEVDQDKVLEYHRKLKAHYESTKETPPVMVLDIMKRIEAYYSDLM